MQITKATEYGVRVILELSSRQEPEQPVTIDELCQVQNIPAKYFRKMIIMLINAGLVRSYRGPKGGLALGRPPAKISLYDVIKVTEGEIMLNVCLSGADECNQIEACPVHDVWARAQGAMLNELKQVDFAELAQKYRVAKG